MVRRFRAASGTRPGETVEPQVWSQGRAFLGGCSIGGESVVLEQAQSRSRPRSTI